MDIKALRPLPSGLGFVWLGESERGAAKGEEAAHGSHGGRRCATVREERPRGDSDCASVELLGGDMKETVKKIKRVVCLYDGSLKGVDLGLTSGNSTESNS
ncbi:hypothetical protein SESBI_51156 [Sesbania bispinosa]|nr:hypothetical protein SESBI_51156 [Sesbania bispinosa]